ncbi:MAG: putative lipid II flippase FtsW [Gammaproteobacteria bacterium]|nr:putative lipid II flippase FtsW [Gammaproteobacteria bacterium]
MSAQVLETRYARTPDAWLTGVAAALLLIGIVMVASASMSIAENELGAPFHYLLRQLAYAGVGLVAALAAYAVPSFVWERTGPLLLAAAFVLLALVLVPGVGHTVNGSTRWVSLGPANLQVSEPARLLILMYLCGYVVRRRDALAQSFLGFLKPLLIVIFACALLLAQPDFGAATVLLAAALGVLLVGGVRLRDFCLLFVTALAAFGGLAVTSAYRLERLMAFRDPWADPYDTGFQLTQSLIAIGRGEWLGVGLGSSVQKLFYLPEAHTDFLFAVLAEEFGLLGVTVVIGLFAALVGRAFWIAERAARVERPFQACLAFAIGTLLGLQAAINIGVNMGLLPTKGLTLPLLSYGGSSLLVTCAAIGLLLRIQHETTALRATGKQRIRKRRHSFHS